MRHTLSTWYLLKQGSVEDNRDGQPLALDTWSCLLEVFDFEKFTHFFVHSGKTLRFVET